MTKALTIVLMESVSRDSLTRMYVSSLPLKLKLYLFDLLWIYCGFVVQQAVQQIHNKSNKCSLSLRCRDDHSFGKQNAIPVSLQTGGSIPCRPNPAATLLVITSDKGGGKCFCLCSFVCLSVSKITQKCVHGFG